MLAQATAKMSAILYGTTVLYAYVGPASVISFHWARLLQSKQTDKQIQYVRLFVCRNRVSPIEMSPKPSHRTLGALCHVDVPDSSEIPPLSEALLGRHIIDMWRCIDLGCGSRWGRRRHARHEHAGCMGFGIDV